MQFRGFILMFLLCFQVFNVWAVKVSGVVFDPSGEPLAFTSVWVKGQSFGTTANSEGAYILDLPANATYEIVYQFLGYKTHTEIVELKNSDLKKDVKLSPQVTQLASVEVVKSKEDPAVSIMRKAIMKSKIHDKQVESYTAKIYSKSNLLINKVPDLFKKELAKNNIKVGVPAITEELLEVKFAQPNTRKVRRLAKQKSLDQIDISGGYYLLNLYQSANSEGVVSPLAPNAFSYYNFEYIGYFEENGKLINKIQVRPKSFGPGVYRGQIWIVEDLWNIYSFDLETVEQGILMKIKQSYASVKNVFVPISQTLDLGGKILGFDFKCKILVNPKYESLEVNQRFVEEVKIVDTKSARKKSVIWGEKELSLKQMNKLIKESEKEAGPSNIVREDSFSVDSMSTKRDLAFWESVRSVPLTFEESKGYVIGDSLKLVTKAQEMKKDSSKTKKILRTLTQPISLGKQTKVDFKYPFIPFYSLNYDIVQGFFADASINLKHRGKQVRYAWENDFRYAFGMDKLMAKSQLSLNYKKTNFYLGAESFSKTIDSKQNVPLFANSIFNFFGLNLTQLYYQEGFNFGYKFKNSEVFSISSDLAFSERSMLQNMDISKPIFGNRTLTPNTPINAELANVEFEKHKAVIWETSISYLPGAQYRLRNGRKLLEGSNWPTLKLDYKKSMADVNYDFVSLSAQQTVKVGAKERLKYYAEIGDFLNDKNLKIMDMRHINTIDYSGNYAFYRLLNTDLPLQLSPENYYRYSTKGQYIKLHAIQEFRKMFITQLPVARFTGLKEDLFINYLKTPAKKNYLELGYGIDGIFKLLRLELITAFENGGKQRWGWQIGVTL